MRLATCIYNSNEKLIEMLKVCVWSANINTSTEMIEIYHDNGIPLKDQEQIQKKVPKVRLIPMSVEINFDTELASQKLNIWNQIVHKESDKGQNLVLIDCDTLITKDIKDVFDNDFDLAYTAKDDPLMRYPLNTGVVFLKIRKPTCNIMQRWCDETSRILINKDLKAEAIMTMGGADQCSLAKILDRFSDFLGPITVGDFHYIGLRASEFNLHKDWSDPSEARIIHYKGTWPDVLINEAKKYEDAIVISKWASRKMDLSEIYSWKPSYDLWKKYYRDFYVGLSRTVERP